MKLRIKKLVKLKSIKGLYHIREAEKCYTYLEAVEKEREKEKPDASKVRVKERQLLVDLFKEQGLTEETILNNMSTKHIQKRFKISFEKSTVMMKKIQKLKQKKRERQESNFNKRYFIEH